MQHSHALSLYPVMSTFLLAFQSCPTGHGLTLNVSHSFPKQIDKPDSVLFDCSKSNHHLSCPYVTIRIFAVLPSLLELQEDTDTTLHRGKDLAVSLFDFAQNLATLNLYEDLSIAGYLLLSEEGVSARTSRLTAYGSYPLPLPPLRATQCP